MLERLADPRFQTRALRVSESCRTAKRARPSTHGTLEKPARAFLPTLDSDHEEIAASSGGDVRTVRVA